MIFHNFKLILIILGNLALQLQKPYYNGHFSVALHDKGKAGRLVLLQSEDFPLT